MLRTYKAILKGDRVEWIEKPPDSDHPIQVHITILEEPESRLSYERGRAMAKALEELSERKAFSEIDDPVSWQRDVRNERPLPERDI